MDTSKYEEYFSKTNENVTLENNINADLIKNTYKTEIEKQIRKDLESLGFNINKISFEFDIETGKISNLALEISKEDTSKVSNRIVVNKIEIGNTSKSTKNNTLSKQEIESIKSKIKEDYGLEYEEITITSI